jgi:hypothetical protein
MSSLKICDWSPNGSRCLYGCDDDKCLMFEKMKPAEIPVSDGIGPKSAGFYIEKGELVFYD